MLKIIFLDTNIFLHYQGIDQIDWLKLAEADAVEIIVPPVTIRELNKHKDCHPRTTVRERANKILKKLSSLFISSPQAQLRSSVLIRLEDRDPLIDFGEYSLTREIQDDNLIASIIMCRDEMQDKKIILVTSDAGLLLLTKAKRHGITTISLPSELKLPEEPSAENKRIKGLEIELKELKLKVPKIFLNFNDGSRHAKFIVRRPIELTPWQIEQGINELQKRYPKREKHPKDTIAGIAVLINTKFISPEVIAKYNEDLDDFYRAYTVYLQNNMSFQNIIRRRIKLDIWLSNNGSAPAEDIDIFMHFPEGLSVMSENDFPEQPKPPKPPSPPKTAMENLMDTMTILERPPYLDSIISASILRQQNISPMNINGNKINVHVQRIKHKLRESFNTFYVIFKTFEAALSFHIDYRILAANLPNEMCGKLHVIIQKEM